MIAFIQGKIALLDPTFVILDVNGIGYEIKIPLSTFSNLRDKTEARLHTHLHVREDAHTLYGFFDTTDKQIFLALTGVSGIGPNTGLMMLSSLSSLEIQHAIIQEDVKVIQGVKGIGQKTAQRLILELKDKFRKEGISDGDVNFVAASSNTVRKEALTALVTLGIPRLVAEKNVDKILKDSGNDIVLEDLIKLALKRA